MSYSISKQPYFGLWYVWHLVKDDVAIGRIMEHSVKQITYLSLDIDGENIAMIETDLALESGGLPINKIPALFGITEQNKTNNVYKLPVDWAERIERI